MVEVYLINDFLFNFKQIVRGYIESFAKINDFFVIEFDFSRFVFAVIGLVFSEFVGNLFLRKPHRFSCRFKIVSNNFSYVHFSAHR